MKLIALVLAGLLPPAFSAFSAAPEKPNLILILADDLSANALPDWGADGVETPALSKLAAEGMRFTHCYSPSLCMPSRVELLTGKYSYRSYLGRGNLSADEPNIASELRKTGYATCQIEKWHLNINNGAMPPAAGFDEYYHTKLAHNYFDPVFDVNGEEKSYPGDYGPKIGQEFAFDFIERHREQPFFLYYAMHLPHAPYHVPPGFEETDDKDLMYSQMIEHMDAFIGELVGYLEGKQLRERTLILFVGDNGTPKDITYRTGGERVRGGKTSLLDGGTHVPMIVSWPGTAPSGVVTDNLIDFADFLPTAMKLAGLKTPRGGEFDGRSFHRQLLGDPDAPVRDWAFKFGVKNGGGEEPGGPLHGYWARTQQWKLWDDGRFFDITKDPREESPIAAGEAGENSEAARAMLQKALDESGAAEATKRYAAARRKQDRKK